MFMKALSPSSKKKQENSGGKRGGDKTIAMGDRPRHHNKDHKPKKKDFTIYKKDSE